MNELLKIVLSLSLSGSLLSLVLFLCKPLFKNRISKRWQYYIWLVVVARLLLPFAPETSIVGALFQEADNGMVQADVIPANEQGNTADEPQPGNDVTTGDGSAMQGGETVKPDAPLAQTVWGAVLPSLWFVWLAVAFILLIRKITVYQGFVRYIRAGRTEVSDTTLLDSLAQIGEKLGVKRPVELYTNSLISSPLLLGFFSPCIVLPTADFPDSDFEYIILHELTHYKRRDMFYKWLVQFAVCAHWFNPLAYLMGREVSRACELACDEAVIRKLDTKKQREYGDTLINAIGAGGSYNNSLASVTLGESRGLLKERLAAIMSFKKIRKSTAVIAILLAAGLFALGFALGSYTAPPVSEKTQEEQTVLSDEGLPIMNAKNRGLYESYLEPIAVTGLLYRNFSPEDISALLADGSTGLLTLVEALENKQMSEYMRAEMIPAAFVDEVLTKRFSLRADKIHEVCADIYNEESDAYHYTGGLGGGPAIPIVTGSITEGKLITIYYVWFVGDPSADTFKYMAGASGQLIIDLSGDDFKYLSNRVVYPAPAADAAQQESTDLTALKPDILPVLQTLIEGYTLEENQGVDYMPIPEYCSLPTVETVGDFILSKNEIGLTATIPIDSEWQMDVLVSGVYGGYITSGASFNIIPDSFMGKAMARGFSFGQVRHLINSSFLEEEILTMPMEKFQRLLSQMEAVSNVDEDGFVTLGYVGLTDMADDYFEFVYPGDSFLGLKVAEAKVVGIPYNSYVLEAKSLDVAFDGQLSLSGSFKKAGEEFIFTVAEESEAMVPISTGSSSSDIVIANTAEAADMLGTIADGDMVKIVIKDYSISNSSNLSITEDGDVLAESPRKTQKATLVSID